MFLGKYFPPSMVTKLRNEITNFRQHPNESLFEAWERYKLDIDRCPNHNMFPITQIDTFYNGLTLRHRDTINAAAGGTFMKRQIAALKAEIAEINKNLTRVLQVNQQVKAVAPNYETCGGPHSFNDCLATVGNTHNVHDVGAYQAYQALVYQALVHQPQIPQPQVVTTNEFTNFMKANDAILKNIQTNMTSLTNSNLELKNMFGQFMKMNTASSLGLGTLSGNTITNPKEDMKGITTCSGTANQGLTIPTTSSSLPLVVERETEVTKDMVHPTNNESTKDVQPSFVQSESLILNSEPVISPIIEPVASPKLPEKLGDLGKFLILCDFPRMAECLALADLDASINLMPLSVWNKLSLPEVSPMCMTLELVDRSIYCLVRVAEDVFVKVGTFYFPADFVVVDFDADPQVPLILGRSFLKTGRALIDVFEGELTLRVGKEAITFNLNQTSRYSANYNDMTANQNDVIDMDCEKYSQEVLDDPTSPKVDQSYVDYEGDILLLEAFLSDDSSLPSLNQGNYLPGVRKELKIYEAKSEKSSIDEPLETESPILNSEPVVAPIIEPVASPTRRALIDVFEGELTFRVGKEAITFNLNQTSRYSANYNDMTANRIDAIDMACEEYSQEVLGFFDVIELKICEAKSDKSSINEPPEVELKDLPPHLEYAFLEGDDKLPVIFAKDLSVEEKTALITVLKSHKRAIAWKLSDIKVIDPEFYTHKILMEEDFEPVVQHQRRVNPKIHDVIKNEVLKLLDAGLIYPISDSPWGIVLGQKISKEGIEVDKDKVDIIAKLPHPTTVKGIRSFLGHAGFYRRFIQDFSKIARPMMTHLLEKDTPFFFSKECVEAFQTLKRKLTEAPILITPDWDMPFELMCYASDFAIGAVLGQHQEKCFRPIHYASKTMTEAKSNYTTTKKEMLAVVYAFKKFRSYLIMNKSIVYTDHFALKYLFAKRDSKARLLRWVLLLQEFTFKGAENMDADHLSRLENPHQNVLDPKEINESFPLETLNLVSTRDDELSEKELKQIKADDQAIQTILLGLPEDIYAAVDSCESAQEIWLRVQQMMKGSDIGIQEKKAKQYTGQNAGNLAGYNDVIGNQVIQNVAQNLSVQNIRNQNGLIGVQGNGNQNQIGNGIQLQAEEYDLMVVVADLEEIKEVNANCILMANLQQASTSDGSAENDNDVISEDTSVEQGGEIVKQHPANFEETRALYESLYQNLAIEVEKISELNKQLSKEISTVTSFLEEKKKLKSDFKTREDKLLDKEIQLEKKIKELNNILLKTGQSIQTIHMLSPKPDSFYHIEQKMALEETLQLAQEGREKMKQLNKEIKPANYTKINHLSRVFVPQTAMSREELYFSNNSKTTNVLKSISIPNENFSDDTTPSVARKFLNE
nr:hypothetical protein [Tanacetum cinerariifolium]